MEEQPYPSIRDALGELIGDRIIEITQQDKEYFDKYGYGFVDLMMESGSILRIWSLHGDEPFMALNSDSDTPIWR